MKTTLMIFAAAGLAVSSAPAMAGGISVKYDDLNLASPAGQEALDKRIEVAARKVCGADTPTTGTRLQSSEARRCVVEAKRSATQQVAAVVEQRQMGG